MTDRAQLIAEVAQLSRRQRAAVVLRYFVGLSDADIAAEMGCSEGTVRSHISHALSSLRVQTARPEGVEESDERLAH